MPHDKFIAELEAFSVSYKKLKLIGAFLKSRKANRLKGTISSRDAIVSGVVQCSIFGPLLFTFYINDLLAACLEWNFKLYASDSKAYKIITCPCDMNLLQLSLYKLHIWTQLWELDLSYIEQMFLLANSL